MKEKKSLNWRTELRIVWAILSKDLLEALKNKNAISVIITALFISVAYSFIPALTALDNATNLLVYDAASSPLSAQLKESQALEVYLYPSEEVMLEKLAHGEVPELGLVIPADFTASLSADQDQQALPTLTGYVLYWVSPDEIARLTQEVETEITRLTGKPVQIQMAEERLVPNSHQHSLGFWVGAALVFLTIYTSLGLISNMMLEEKQSHTLEALLVSPAGEQHVVSAKAMTGLFYCLLGVGVTLAIDHKIILHWWLIILTLVPLALFSVSLGLIAGSLVEERGQLSLWTFGLLLPLYIPVFLSFMDELFPQWFNQVLMLFPSATATQLFLASFSFLPPAGTLLAQFAWLVAWAIGGLAAAIWVMRWKEQKKEGDQESWTNKAASALRSKARYAKTPSPGSQWVAPASLSSMSIQSLGQNALPATPASGWRIVRSIAAKDLHQAIHNKLIVSILLGTVLLVAGNAVLIYLIGAAAGSPTDLAAASSPVLAMMVSITLFTLGVALVPLLMLEEKEAHTLETLLVSPARYLQIVAGKALAGAIYCLSGLLVIVIAYRFLIVHWELALLAMLAGTAFVVALGLLVGIVSNNQTTIMMWATTILLILIVPTVLSGLSSFTQAPWLEALIDYWPSTATYKLLTLAMTVEIPKGMVIENAAIVISAAILLYMLTWWLVRRSDQ